MATQSNNIMLSGGERIVAATICLAAFFMLISHGMLVAAFGGVGFVVVILTLLVSCFIWPRFSFCLLVVSIAMQNLCLSLVVGMMDDAERFQLFQGTNFLVPVIVFVYAAFYVFYKRHLLQADLAKIILWGTIFAAIVVVYSIYGAAQSSFKSAIVYFRVYIYGYMTLIIGIAFGMRLKPKFMEAVFYLVGWFVVSYGIIEFLFPYELYSLTNTADFLRLKLANFSVAEHARNLTEIIADSTRSYLNLSGQFQLDLHILRIMGPSYHPISYAYALAFFALMGRKSGNMGLFLLAIVPLFLAAAKGPIVLYFFSVIGILIYRMRPSIKALKLSMTTVLTLYVIVVLIYGYISRDYHFVGLMGGVNGFFHNPLGYGIGVGGNLSELSTSGEKDMVTFQNTGATFAVESAIGVLLYQVGLAIGVFIVFYYLLVKKLYLVAAQKGYSKLEIARNLTVPVALSIMFAGAIFQEEAFSPTGIGLWMLAAGIMLVPQKNISEIVK